MCIDKEDLFLKQSLLSSVACRDFGSIFSMLLPGTMAKLEPPEGGDFMDGLEVRVAFGGVWKQSLSELSGGQRSLLALSLILALLLFKPAPLYILDEVCYLFVPTIPVVYPASS
jgi:chromosome segregation ATPase